MGRNRYPVHIVRFPDNLWSWSPALLVIIEFQLPAWLALVLGKPQIHPQNIRMPRWTMTIFFCVSTASLVVILLVVFLSLRLSVFNHVSYDLYTDKKENNIFLIYKEILSEAVAKSKYTRKGFLIYKEMRKYFPIYCMRRLLVIYDFATAPFWISLYMRKIRFSFLSVYHALFLSMLAWEDVEWPRLSRRSVKTRRFCSAMLVCLSANLSMRSN